MAKHKDGMHVGKSGTFHGSPHETHELHDGKKYGNMQGELVVGSHPGSIPKRITPYEAKEAFEGGKGGKVPKTGRPYTEE